MSNDQNSTRKAQPFSSTEPSQLNARRSTFGRRTQGNEVFPQLPIAPDATPDGVDHSDPQDTNQIMPAPCKFISPQLPLCSAIRPVATAQAGAQAAIAGLTASGLFNGQNRAFFNRLAELAEEADEARRDG